MAEKKTKEGINWGFISAREGGSQKKGYIPKKKSGEVFGKSGVTIATGWDVGQMSSEEIKNSGLSESIIKKVLPFAGAKKQDAVRLLEKFGEPRITSKEASEIDNYTHGKAVSSLKKYYNKETGRNFEDLTSGKQTVVASVAFQYGSNLKKVAPNFWKQIISDDWLGVVKNLENFDKGKYQHRRNLEAALLKSDLASTNIAFAARGEVKKNAASVAFESMESVNKEDNSNIQNFENEMKAARAKALKRQR